LSEEKAKNKAPHIYREDPNGDKEDTRPIEKKRGPRFSIDWEKLKGWLES